MSDFPEISQRVWEKTYRQTNTHECIQTPFRFMIIKIEIIIYYILKSQMITKIDPHLGRGT